MDIKDDEELLFIFPLLREGVDDKLELLLLLFEDDEDFLVEELFGNELWDGEVKFPLLLLSLEEEEEEEVDDEVCSSAIFWVVTNKSNIR